MLCQIVAPHRKISSQISPQKQGGRRASVGKSAVLTPLDIPEFVVQTPLLPGMSMCAFQN